MNVIRFRFDEMIESTNDLESEEGLKKHARCVVCKKSFHSVPTYIQRQIEFLVDLEDLLEAFQNPGSGCWKIAIECIDQQLRYILSKVKVRMSCQQVTHTDDCSLSQFNIF